MNTVELSSPAAAEIDMDPAHEPWLESARATETRAELMILYRLLLVRAFRRGGPSLPLPRG